MAKTYQEWLEAVKKRGSSLGDVPKAIMSEELCLAAIQGDVSAYHFVPGKFKTAEFNLIYLELRDLPLKEGTPLDSEDEKNEKLEGQSQELKKQEEKRQRIMQEYPNTYFEYPDNTFWMLVNDETFEDTYNWSFTSSTDIESDELSTPEELKEEVQGLIKKYSVNSLPQTEAFWYFALMCKGEVMQCIPNPTERLCLLAVSHGDSSPFTHNEPGKYLEYVPYDLRTPAVCRAAVKNFGEALKDFLPPENITPEICLEATRNFGTAINETPGFDSFDFKTKRAFYLASLCSANSASYRNGVMEIPDEFKSVDFYMEAVKSCILNSEMLGYIPNEYKTPELCMEAVKRDPYSLRFIPRERQTTEMCLVALNADIHPYYHVNPLGDATPLSYMAKHLKTPELCLLAAKRWGGSIWAMPKELQTDQMYIEQYRSFGQLCPRLEAPKKLEIALALLDNEHRFKPGLGYYMEASKTLKHHGLEEFMDSKYWPALVKTNGLVLTSILEEVKEDEELKELCRPAVEQNGMAYHFVPYNYRTKELLLLALQTQIYNPALQKNNAIHGICGGRDESDSATEILQYLPPEERTPELCNLAFEKHPGSVVSIPVSLISPAMFKAAVIENPIILALIPESDVSVELCTLAFIEHGAKALDYIPDTIKTPLFFAKAVLDNHEYCLKKKENEIQGMIMPYPYSIPDTKFQGDDYWLFGLTLMGQVPSHVREAAKEELMNIHSRGLEL